MVSRTRSGPQSKEKGLPLLRAARRITAYGIPAPWCFGVSRGTSFIGSICDAVDKDRRRQGSNDNFSLTVRRSPGYFLFLWYCVLLNKGGGAHERLHESPAPAVLPGTGVSRHPAGTGRDLPDPSGGPAPPRLGPSAGSGGPGVRTAGGGFPGRLHRRVPAGIAGELEPYNFEDEEEERCQRRLGAFERRSLAQKGE